MREIELHLPKFRTGRNKIIAHIDAEFSLRDVDYVPPRIIDTGQVIDAMRRLCEAYSRSFGLMPPYWSACGAERIESEIQALGL